jgi:CheY-like chemotaxis protein
MAKPALVLADDEDTSLQALARELESRYGVHYQVVSSSSAEMALARLAELKAAGADVPLVLADQRMPGMSGTQLLARVRQFFPRARRGLLISWGDRATPAPFLEAAALGWLEFYRSAGAIVHVAARPGLEPAAGPRRGHKLASRSVSVMPGPCPVRMNHSVPNAMRKNSSGMPRKNDCSLIWLAWARMARRL